MCVFLSDVFFFLFVHSIFDSLRPPEFSLKRIECAQKKLTHSKGSVISFVQDEMTQMLQNSKEKERRDKEIE